MERKRLFSGVKRVVVKVGTACITENLVLDERKIGKVVGEMMDLLEDGIELIVVSSGAIGAGIRVMGLKSRPRDMNMLQATAAVGQNELMKAYGKSFDRYGRKVAQIMLTREDFCDRSRFINIRNTVNALLKSKVVPIVNENDSVAVDEIRFGDNDTLSALVASNMEADLLVLLSSMDGLYTKDPARSRKALKIEVVDKVTSNISSIRGKSRKGGVGGIQSKIEAGRIMMKCGIPMVIVDYRSKKILSKVLEGENVGTLFHPRGKLENKQQWMLFSSKPKGTVKIDSGAKKIIVKGKSSLLPPGVKDVRGSFEKGEVVKVVDERGREIARGLSNFNSEELGRISGAQCRQIKVILKKKCPKEVISRRNMVLVRR